MPICNHCGVEIEKAQAYCPLCCFPIEGETSRPDDGLDNLSMEIKDSTPSQKRWFWGLITLLALGSLAIVAAVDLAYDMSVTWSRYPLISIGYLWCAITLVLYLRKRVFLLLLSETACLGLYFWIFNLFTPLKPWFFSLFVPIYLMVFVFFEFTRLLAQKLKLTIIGILAVSMINLSLFLLALELTLNRHLYNRLFISWSLIVFACILTLTTSFLFIQKKYGIEENNLRKRFHV